MTQSIKERIVTGVIVGMMMILVQTIFTSFKGRWDKGSMTNDFVGKKEYVKNRELDLNKACIYADDQIDAQIDALNKIHSIEHDNIELQLSQVKELQEVQIRNINKNISEILDRLSK